MARIRRICWACSGLFECAPAEGAPPAGICHARCPYCQAITSTLVPPPCAPPFPGAFERPRTAPLALRRVRQLLKRRRQQGAGGIRYLVEWEEDPTADFALQRVGCATLQPMSWENSLHVSLDPALVASFDENRRPDKETVLAAARPASGPTLGPVSMELTVANHLTAAPGEYAAQPAPRAPAMVWLSGDRVEVQWKGKGFKGSWALADVVDVDGEQVRVRFVEFVDEMGGSLNEWVPSGRVRLLPPAVCRGWRPNTGERVEARSNDLWWEGSIERYDSIKGYLFAYDCHRSWVWLPLDGMRPRPRAVLGYHLGRARPGQEAAGADGSGDESEEDDELSERARKEQRWEKCSHAGCELRERHAGLCQFGDDSLAGRARERSTRPKAGQIERPRTKLDMLEQEEILESIRRKRIAKEASARARDPRMPSKVIPGSRMAQWHPQLFSEHFCLECATVVVFETARTPAGCRGQLVILASQIVADVLMMLRTELGIRLDGKRVLCVPHTPVGTLPAAGEALLDLTAVGRGQPVVNFMPADARVDLLVIDS